MNQIKKLTLDQRLYCYKKTLEYLEDALLRDFTSANICPLLITRAESLFHYPNKVCFFYSDVKEVFPEFYSFKPIAHLTNSEPWFSENKKGLKHRIEILKKCVEIVESEIKTINT